MKKEEEDIHLFIYV